MEAGSEVGKSRYGMFVVIACGLLLVSGMLLQPVLGDSYRLNLTWHEAFVSEMRAGHLYPRWLSVTNSGLGSPSFYFYAPWPFWISAMVQLAIPFDLSPADCVHASAALAVTLSGVAMYLTMQRWSAQSVAAISAIVYMAMPYHFALDLWWRAALGELWGFVWLPLILFGLHAIVRGERQGVSVLSIACAGLILSHLPSFLVATCGIAMLAVTWLVLNRADQRAVRISVESCLAIALASALSACYWLPALTTIGLTDINGVMMGGRFVYSENFIELFAPWTLAGKVELTAPLMLAAFGIFILAASRLQCGRDPRFRLAAWSTAGAMLMITPASNVIWRILPPLQRVQFPWRFLILVDLGLVVMLAVLIKGEAASHMRKWMVRSLPVFCLLMGVLVPKLMTPRHSAEDEGILATHLRTRADALEYRTKWTSAAYYRDVRRGAAPVQGDDAGNGIRTVASNRDRVVATRPGGLIPERVVLRRFYYPNVRVFADDGHESLRLRPEQISGLTVVDVPAGVRSLRIDTILLPQEKAGWLISAFAASVFVLLRLRVRGTQRAQ